MRVTKYLEDFGIVSNKNGMVMLIPKYVEIGTMTMHSVEFLLMKLSDN